MNVDFSLDYGVTCDECGRESISGTLFFYDLNQSFDVTIDEIADDIFFEDWTLSEDCDKFLCPFCYGKGDGE